MSLYSLIRPLIFRCDPESAHNATVRLAELLGRSRSARWALERRFAVADPRLHVEVAGLCFPNPLGLAAGFDKNGRAVPLLGALGFGSVEIGSVSAHPSAGNPRPRLFRLPADEAIMVAYGVPNEGAEAVSARLRRLPAPPVPLGVNLVETNTGQPSPVDRVIAEFVEAAGEFVGVAHYLALNLSCPNSVTGKGLFDESEAVAALLDALRSVEQIPPVFLKVVPTTDPGRIDAWLELMDAVPFVYGVIFNLPPGRPYTLQTPEAKLALMRGAVSGRPTRALMNEAIRAWYPRMDRTRHIIVGSGGIFTAEDAYQKLRLGASLLQAYTVLIYHGPSAIARINRGLIRLLANDGFKHISEVVGTAPTRAGVE